MAATAATKVRPMTIQETGGNLGEGHIIGQCFVARLVGS